jgi:hypothetical protein
MGEAAGRLEVRAVYARQERVDPYTFAVRLRPADPSTAPTIPLQDVTISKEQYDLIMNVLNAFHPIGVEVSTRAIRERVVEVREGLLDAFPDYTYPNFRVRGAAPVRRPASREEG